MNELINQIKEASQKLVNDYSVQDITIYLDEDSLPNKKIRIGVEI